MEAVAPRAKPKTLRQLGTHLTENANQLAELEMIDLDKLKAAAQEAHSASNAHLDSDAVQGSKTA
eukprot:3116994-Pleurochrysis_carterae.AAC.1